MKQFREPATGFLTSVSVKGVQDLTEATDKLITAGPSPEHTIMVYFLIGIAGALGGLLVKISWGIIKRKFPKLQNIDK